MTTPPAPPESLAWMLHHLAVAGARADVAISRSVGVSATDYLALKHLLGADEPIGPAGLGTLLGMTSGSATALVDRLERSGHLERRPHPSDRRRQALAVSPSTAAAILAELEPLGDAVEEAAASLTADERAVVGRFLAQATRAQDEVSRRRSG